LLAAVLAASLVFWSAVLALGALRRNPVSMLTLCFSAMMPTSLLGALRTFSQSLWYPTFGARAAAWGLTPLDDQRLAGLIMWAPMNMVHLVAALRRCSLGAVRGIVKPVTGTGRARVRRRLQRC
jgi:putative membrane protein